MFFNRLSATFLAIVPVLGAELAPSDSAIVKLNYGSFQGNVNGALEEFLGMPFAAPPYDISSVEIVSESADHVLYT